MLLEDDADDDVLKTAEATADADAITFADEPVRLGVIAVDVDFAAFAGALGLRPGLEQAGDVEPDVQTNGVGPSTSSPQIRISTLLFARSAFTNACVSLLLVD